MVWVCKILFIFSHFVCLSNTFFNLFDRLLRIIKLTLNIKRMEAIVSFGLFLVFLLLLRLSVSNAKNHSRVSTIKRIVDEKEFVIARPLKDHRKNVFFKMFDCLITVFLWMIWRKRWICKIFYSNGNAKGYLSEWPSSKDRVRVRVIGFNKCLGMYKLEEID